jgi:hypothetical protein
MSLLKSPDEVTEVIFVVALQLTVLVGPIIPPLPAII